MPRLAASSGEERRELFKETRERTLGKTVPALPGAAQPVPPSLAGPAIGPVPSTARIGFRSFDLQWVLADSRLLDFPRRPLWRSNGARQVYLTTHVTAAPLTGTVATATAYVPELNHYAGRGGLAIPLWRDAEGTDSNVAPGLPSLLAERLGTEIAEEDIFLYVAALMAHPAYSTRFVEELGQPGPRIPLTTNPALFRQATAVGRRVLWLHTFAERFDDPSSGRPADRVAQGTARSGAPVAGQGLPEAQSVSYEPASATLTVGSGTFVGVSPEVWAYEATGWRVVRRWLTQRTGLRAGRRLSPWTTSRPPGGRRSGPANCSNCCDPRGRAGPGGRAGDLLGRIATGPLMSVADVEGARVLPVPPAAQKPAPETQQATLDE